MTDLYPLLFTGPVLGSFGFSSYAAYKTFKGTRNFKLPELFEEKLEKIDALQKGSTQINQRPARFSHRHHQDTRRRIYQRL